MEPSAIEVALRERGVPEDIAADLAEVVPGDAQGVLLYGSRARGDHTPDSDVDLLCLVDAPNRPRSSTQANVSFYTPEQLRSASGTLFGMHIKRDGVILLDRTGALATIVGSLAIPEPTVLIARIRHFSTILDVAGIERDRYVFGLVRLGRYLLRTAIYAAAAAAGQPCFSVRELAVRFRQPQLVRLLASDTKARDEASREVLEDLTVRIRDVVGSPVANPHGSIRALIVAEWDSDAERATLAMLAISNRTWVFDYDQQKKVLL